MYNKKARIISLCLKSTRLQFFISASRRGLLQIGTDARQRFTFHLQRYSKKLNLQNKIYKNVKIKQLWQQKRVHQKRQYQKGY